MNCPYCGADGRHSVKETRDTDDGRIVRRRECSVCKQRFATAEQLTVSGLRVRKSHGQAVPFNRDFVRKSIRKAMTDTWRRDDQKIDALVADVVADVYPQAENGEVASADIARAVLRRLRQFDPASHIRFALVQSGRRDRQDQRQGWRDANDVRRWLVEEYPELQHYRAPSGLAEVVKRDGRREPFDREKLEKSIGFASKGYGSRDEVWQLASDVATDVEQALSDQPIVTTGQIAAEILRNLRDLDHIAYLRFASTAKSFTEPEHYEAEAVALRQLPPHDPLIG
jgi:transcriptional repressor NrdR